MSAPDTITFQFAIDVDANAAPAPQMPLQVTKFQKETSKLAKKMIT